MDKKQDQKPLEEGIARPSGRILYNLDFILKREPARRHLENLGIKIRPNKQRPSPA